MTTMDSALAAALASLREMPSWIEAGAAKIAPELQTRRPQEGGFCMVEQAWHLAELEEQGFGRRIHRIVSEVEPHLEDFDGARIAREGDYASRDLREGLARFRAARTANLAAFRLAGPGDWTRTAIQDGVGHITLADVPGMMREHDASHRGEIEALLSELAEARTERFRAIDPKNADPWNPTTSKPRPRG
jgi:hypothetical protein